MTARRRQFCSAGWLAAAMLACAEPAAAGDWSLRTSMLERLSANDNFNLNPDPDGIVFGAYSELGLDFDARSHRYEFSLDGKLGYQAYFGDSSDEPSNRYLPSLNASYLQKGKTTDFSLGASYVLEPATEDNGLLIEEDTAKGDRETFSANTSVIHRLNARNSATLSARATRIDFIDAGKTDFPNTSIGGTAGWTHRATKRTDFTLTNSLDWYSYEDDRDRERLYGVSKLGLSTQLSKRLSATAGAGVTLNDTIRDRRPPATGRIEVTSFGTLADFSFTYLLKTGTLTGNASYGLTPDENGKFSNALDFGSALTYRINDMTEFRFGAQYRLSDSATDGELANTSLSLSPSISYTLARDWLLTGSYQFAWSDDEKGQSTQNAVYLTLSRSYVLVP
jgi:hypothetical protein